MNIEEALKVFGKIKVLHIDDEELQLEMLKINLERLNDDIIVDSEVDSLKDLTGKEIDTIVESKDSSFLCLKLFN